MNNYVLRFSNPEIANYAYSIYGFDLVAIIFFLIFSKWCKALKVLPLNTLKFSCMPFYNSGNNTSTINRQMRFIFICCIAFGTFSCQKEKVDFNVQVRPILNKRCIACHGGVKQSGGFGLVFREKALQKTVNDNFGIVPGHPESSEMISRITNSDPEMRMPLDREPLTKEEISILTTWIEQGAEWQDHWSYIRPVDPILSTSESNWIENDIDRFVLPRLEEKGIIPGEKADANDLVRRLYLDIIGLPPTSKQVEAFTQGELDYEQVVDELLASDKFGEHWASMWLDLARFADSKGYEADRYREIWKYRDWVIKAFNANMPFDQFTVEQLAGDLLPDPNIDQLLATAFHRNTLNNGEGGTYNEEYRIASVLDRVNTTWEVWQGTTIGCVQCHSHPYDPIKQKEYYASFAFFNNTADWDVPTEIPLLKELNEKDNSQFTEIIEWIESRSTRSEANKWERFILIGEPKLRPEDFSETVNTTHHNRSNQDYMIVRDESQIRIDNVSLAAIDRIYLSYSQSKDMRGSVIIRTNAPDGPIIAKSELTKTLGFQTIPMNLTNTSDQSDLYIQFASFNEDFSCVIDGFLLGNRLPGEKDLEYSRYYDQIDVLLNASPEHTTPVMVEKPDDRSRETNVFERGNWLVKGEAVSAGIPDLFNKDGRTYENRLDLANWIVSNENPLTGRVIVNRFWARIYGKGLVSTVEDFGALGDKPTHPELLDWLAIRFTGDWEWDVKHLLKTIVMSSTYQQSSFTSDATRKIDPDNQWYSRSPRVRLSAEQIRDQALAISGLLSNKMYGPSVMPTQPEGVWSVVYNNQSWVTSDGEDAYRRGIYTYIRRSSPYPSFISFDASSREFCLSRRITTNTPIQALVTLNDPVYLEAARALAAEFAESKDDEKIIVENAYEKVMGKKAHPDKVEILLQLLNDTQEYYATHQDEAKELAKSDHMNLASYTVLANTLMNLDEFLVKN